MSHPVWNLEYLDIITSENSVIVCYKFVTSSECLKFFFLMSEGLIDKCMDE